jgi:hypothetical protein
MKPRVTLITLGVDHLPRAVAFYRDGLGWKTEGIIGEQFEDGAVAFFDLALGLRLALWPRKSLAKDSGLTLSPRATSDIALAHNVTSRDEVDAVMHEAQRAVAPAHGRADVHDLPRRAADARRHGHQTDRVRWRPGDRAGNGGGVRPSRARSA